MEFHAGQKVRAVSHRGVAETGKIKPGQVGTVLSFRAGDDVMWCDRYRVAWECGLTTDRHHLCLEPIRDDDTNDVVSWSECVWQPKQVRA